MKIYLLYGLENGENRPYMETLLLSCGRNMEDVNKVKRLASKDGFHSFRVATHIDGEMPNFAQALTI
jgi:hypothetical protein